MMTSVAVLDVLHCVSEVVFPMEILTLPETNYDPDRDGHTEVYQAQQDG